MALEELMAELQVEDLGDGRWKALVDVVIEDPEAEGVVFTATGFRPNGHFEFSAEGSESDMRRYLADYWQEPGFVS